MSKTVGLYVVLAIEVKDGETERQAIDRAKTVVTDAIAPYEDISIDDMHTGD